MCDMAQPGPGRDPGVPQMLTRGKCNMRLLMVHPGASFSTADVYTGYRDALQRQGIEVIEYALDQRLEVANRFLKSLFRYTARAEKATVAEITYEASSRIIERALWFKVDFVLHVSCQYLHPDLLVLLRRAHIPNVAILTESPYEDDRHVKLLPYIDVAFTNERTSVERLRAVKEDVYYLPHAYDPATHRPGAQDGDADVPAHDVVFVGTGFPERLDLLAGVDWDGIDLGLYGTYSLLPSRHKLRRYIRGGVTPNATAAALYRRAKIGLNLYRAAPGAESLNPRAVELAACGAFHLSDSRAEVYEVFGQVGCVPTFAESGWLEEKINYYLDNDERREALARRLPACVSHLTFDAQAAYMVSTLRAAWSGASAAIGA